MLEIYKGVEGASGGCDPWVMEFRIVIGGPLSQGPKDIMGQLLEDC